MTVDSRAKTPPLCAPTPQHTHDRLGDRDNTCAAPCPHRDNTSRVNRGWPPNEIAMARLSWWLGNSRGTGDRSLGPGRAGTVDISRHGSLRGHRRPTPTTSSPMVPTSPGAPIADPATVAYAHGYRCRLTSLAVMPCRPFGYVDHDSGRRTMTASVIWRSRWVRLHDAASINRRTRPAGRRRFLRIHARRRRPRCGGSCEPMNRGG
jgi:hypothetical protein